MVLLALLAICCVFAAVCVMGLVTEEISLGRPMRVTYRLAQSPAGFWLVWGIWATLAAASAFGAGYLFRYWRRHRV